MHLTIQEPDQIISVCGQVSLIAGERQISQGRVDFTKQPLVYVPVLLEVRVDEDPLEVEAVLLRVVEGQDHHVGVGRRALACQELHSLENKVRGKVDALRPEDGRNLGLVHDLLGRQNGVDHGGLGSAFFEFQSVGRCKGNKLFDSHILEFLATWLLDAVVFDNFDLLGWLVL